MAFPNPKLSNNGSETRQYFRTLQQEMTHLTGVVNAGRYDHVSEPSARGPWSATELTPSPSQPVKMSGLKDTRTRLQRVYFRSSNNLLSVPCVLTKIR